MGVHGLWRLLDSFGQVTQPENWRGRHVAVDASIWMAQFRAQTKPGGDADQQILEGFFVRILKLMFYGIQPVFVFDGPATSAKSAEHHRRQLRRHTLSQVYLKRRAQQILLAQVSAGTLDVAALPKRERERSAEKKEEDKESHVDEGELKEEENPVKTEENAAGEEAGGVTELEKACADQTHNSRDRKRRKLQGNPDLVRNCRPGVQAARRLAPDRVSKRLTHLFLSDAGERIASRKKCEQQLVENTLRDTSSSLFMGPRRVFLSEEEKRARRSAGAQAAAAAAEGAMIDVEREENYMDVDVDGTGNDSQRDAVKLEVTVPSSEVSVQSFSSSDNDGDGDDDDEEEEVRNALPLYPLKLSAARAAREDSVELCEHGSVDVTASASAAACAHQPPRRQSSVADETVSTTRHAVAFLQSLVTPPARQRVRPGGIEAVAPEDDEDDGSSKEKEEASEVKSPSSPATCTSIDVDEESEENGENDSESADRDEDEDDDDDEEDLYDDMDDLVDEADELGWVLEEDFNVDDGDEEFLWHPNTQISPPPPPTQEEKLNIGASLSQASDGEFELVGGTMAANGNATSLPSWPPQQKQQLQQRPKELCEEQQPITGLLPTSTANTATATDISFPVPTAATAAMPSGTASTRGDTKHWEALPSLQRGTQPIPFELLGLVELLDCCGIPYVLSPAEADAQCALLAREGLVDAVFTEDSDAVVHGAPVVLRGFFASNKHVVEYRCRDMVTCGLTKRVLVCLAYLLGCDYAEGVPGIGLSGALSAITTVWPSCPSSSLSFSAGLARVGKEATNEGVRDSGDDDEDDIDFVCKLLRRWHRLAVGQPASWFDTATVVDGADGGLSLLQFALFAEQRRSWGTLTVPACFPDSEVARSFFSPRVDGDRTPFALTPPDWQRMRVFAGGHGLLSSSWVVQRLELAQREWVAKHSVVAVDEQGRRQRRLDDFGVRAHLSEKWAFKKQPPRQAAALALLRAVQASARGESPADPPARTAAQAAAP